MIRVTRAAFLLTNADNRKIYLESMAILPGFRSTGRGEKGLALLLEKLAGENYRVMELHVRVSNPSRRMYERLGFRVMDEVPGFYADGENAFLMELNFSSRDGN